MKVAVIGAGAAGLCASQQLAAIENEEVSFTVYEQTGNIGGTWVYSENTKVDEYGLPIHSSMYKNLRTNLPKETMEFSSFPFKHKNSFISRTDVLQYLTDFTGIFELKKFIKFYHHVILINPVNDIWEVKVKNLQTSDVSVTKFDAVMICNGHYSEPQIPEYPGRDTFENIQIHSHMFREPDLYKKKKIVIIGSGPSGIDITFDVAPFAEKVYFSHHCPELVEAGFPENVIHKPDVTSLRKNSVEFQDGTVEIVDVILYCTGYKYSFPFLSKDCGITVTDNFVHPLYKHFINISNPTMCFIGIPWQTLIFPLFELQVRCFLNVLRSKVKLPSTKEMFLSLQNEIERRKKLGLKMKYYHRLGNQVHDYMTDLAITFETKPIPQVVRRIYDSAGKRRRECLAGYRDDIYEIIDSINYVLHKNKLT